MGSLSDSYQLKRISTYYCVFILSITTGSERSSLVGILEDGVIATGDVLYNVGSALDDTGYWRHVARICCEWMGSGLEGFTGKWVTICVGMASTLYAEVNYSWYSNA
jgi:hypothetical protein